MKMITIYSSYEHLLDVRNYINTVYRLEELVDVLQVNESISPKMIGLMVDDNRIQVILDWRTQTVPYIFPQHVDLTQNNFLGMIFGYLGNFEKTWEYLAESPLLTEWITYSCIYNCYPIDKEILDDLNRKNKSSDIYEEYRSYHNLALIYYYIYPNAEQSIHRINQYFQSAISSSPSIANKLFTTKHYTNFLLDSNQIDQALDILDKAVPLSENELMKSSLGLTRTQGLMKKLVVPYDVNLLNNLKGILWDTLQYFEKHNCESESALLLIDASMIAKFENNFSESLGYINKAIKLLVDEDLTEILGNAYVNKGILLYTWSKNGNPQFYKASLEAFQDALKIMDKENNPEVFADIHHHLGIIYAEMPDENKKRSVWAALSASSFKEALAFFNKEDYPYEYATIANNYANSMTIYPPMKKADNYAKALELYNQALLVRDPQQFPYERALTLVNYLEASWQVSNEENGFNKVRFSDMMDKALEIKKLVSDPILIQEANKHLEALEKLQVAIQHNA